MSEQDQQRWRKLCERAVSERDPERLCKIIHEANKLIDEKSAERKSKPSESAKT
jgi:hypothetical protein